MKNLYCIVGPSGSGKTTLVEALQKEYGYRVIESYTTRPPRHDGETGHIFVSPDEFKELKDVYAYNQYDGYEYGITAKQLEENDLYIVEPSGVEDLLKRYRGHKGIKVIGLKPDIEVLIERMKLRGDSDDKIINRLIEDADTFKKLHIITDIMFTTELTVNELCEALHSHIENFEYWAKHEFTLFNERGEEVGESYHVFYTLEEAIADYNKANPEGLPEGWTMRDDTVEAIQRYIKAIHKCRPSFKTSMIHVDESTVGRSSDGYMAVAFYYKDTKYFYCEHNGDAWITEDIKSVFTKSTEDVLKDTLDLLYRRRDYINKHFKENYLGADVSYVEDSKHRLNQMKNAVGYIKNALNQVKQEQHKGNAPLLDDVIKGAKEQKNVKDKMYSKKSVYREKSDIFH